VQAGRVDVRRVADAELHVHRGGRADHLGDFVEAHEAALVVRHLDVDVEGRRAGCSQLAELGRREIRGDVDRRRAELLERSRRRRVRAGEEDGGLEDERLRQLAVSLQAAERGEDTRVGHEHRADAQGDCAANLCERPVDARLSARHTADRAGGKGLAARIPGASRPEEERDLDAALRAELGHLRDLGVGQHHHA
jgi:hypothetical protein